MANDFPLEGILNVTPTEYCASVGHELSDYKLVGVHAVAHFSEGCESLLEKFKQEIPVKAEVVVNYRPHYAVASSLFSDFKIQRAEGTALVPREKSPRRD